jgi:hypothetical protein
MGDIAPICINEEGARAVAPESNVPLYPSSQYLRRGDGVQNGSDGVRLHAVNTYQAASTPAESLRSALVTLRPIKAWPLLTGEAADSVSRRPMVEKATL